MSKRIKDEDLRLNIIVNGDPARREMGELDRQTKELARSNKELRAEQRRLKSEGKENTALYKQNAAEIKKNNAAIKANQDRIKQLRSEMKLTSLTTAELSQRHAELRNAMRNVVPGTPQWRQLRNELQAVTARMAQLRTDTTATEGVMCRMATNVNKYIGTVTATFAAAAMYGSGLYKAIQAYSGLDEAMSNARKTTGMTRREVEELSEKLARIDTRTPQNELLSLARVGGKLGIAKNDIEGFTRAADVIKISLGKDLGDDVETTIGQIGKLVNVFQINKEFGIEQGMMKAAAAVNELGKSSTANEANIVEFMRRVGGVGYSAKISLANIAGLGATLDDLGVTMEVAGTSMSQVIIGMFRRTDAFAAAAKMSVKDFRKLMDEDMNEAIIRFAEGMGSDGGAMAKIVEALDGLHLNGQRATGVLTALAKNTAKVREQQQIANKAFDEGTSCQKEFNIMNNTVEATTEKLKKRITEEAAELGKSLIPAYHDSMSVQASLIETARILIEWLIKNRGAVLGLVAAFAAYRTWIFTIDKVSKVYHATIALGSGLKLSYLMAVRATTAATVAETGATKAATIATRLFGAALKSLPLGWVAAAVGAVVGAITYFTTRSGEAAKYQKQLSNNMRDAATEAATERTELDRLKGKLEGCKVGTKEYNDTKQEIIDKFGKYDSTLKSETLTVQTLRDKYNSLTDAIMQSAKTRQYNKFIEAQQSAFDKDLGKISDRLWETLNDQYYTEKASKYYTQIMNAFFGGKSLDAWLTTGTFEAKVLVSQLERLRNEQNAADKEARARFGIAPVGQKKHNEQEWNLDNDAAFLDEKQKLWQKFANGEIATEHEYQDKLLELEIKSLQARLAENKDAGDTRARLKQQLADKLREQENREHQHVVAAEKDKTKWSLDSDAAFLNEKQKLRKKFAEGEISAEQEYQDELLALEIAALEARIAANKESGADRSKLEIQLADKLIEQKKREQQQADAVENLRIQNMTDATERENADYERRKRQYAGNTAALEQLAIAHNRALTKIDLQKCLAALKQEEDEYKQSRQIMEERHRNELRTTNLTRAERIRLKKQQVGELNALDEEYYRNVLAQLRSLSEEGIMSFKDLEGVLQTIDIDSSLLSETEKNDLIRKIKEVSAEAAAAIERIEQLMQKTKSSDFSFHLDEEDQRKREFMFGFSLNDWGIFFDRIKNGKLDAQELCEEIGTALLASANAASMAMDLYSAYDKMMTAKENAELKRYKKNNDAKKKTLQSRLDAGLITQEQFNQQNEQMDAEYERKQEELQIKQAKRQRAMSIAQATISMAEGIAKAIAFYPWPLNLIPIAFASSMGMAQIAMIASTPIAGAEEGGMFVTRAQDDRKFNARVNPDARGYIDRPTVLVGENGMEYVIPNEAMQNPTARPIINMIEAVRQKGRLRDFDFAQIMPAMFRFQGYAAGGQTAGSMPETITLPPTFDADNPENKILLQVLVKLLDVLKGPIKAEVALLGRGNLLDRLKEYERMKKRGQIG